MTKNSAIIQASVDILVQFYDLDPMNVVWHGHYLKYFEQARCALLDQIDYNYFQMRDSGYIWPVVDVRLKYVKSAVFNQLVTVVASLVEYENRLKIEYRVLDSQSHTVLTKGYTIQVAVDNNSQEMLYRSPDILFAKLGVSVGDA